MLFHAVITSTLLPFVLEEEDDEGASGSCEKVVALARNVAMRPETWMDFPFPDGDEDFDGMLLPYS